jgi:putative oxidoreductase
MSLIRDLLSRFDRLADHLQAPLLLIVRLYWGLAFAQTGWGKLMNLERTTAFFAELGLPLPGANAFAAGAVECFGGVLLALGLLSRPAATALAFTMLVAYATADREALRGILAEPDAFTGAAPFLFLLASLLVLAFGPGAWSVDARLRRPAPAA